MPLHSQIPESPGIFFASNTREKFAGKLLIKPTRFTRNKKILLWGITIRFIQFSSFFCTKLLKPAQIGQ